MSAEELALCSAIAEFRNSISSSEQPWCAGDVRGINDKLLMQLFDVCFHPLPCYLIHCHLHRDDSTAVHTPVLKTILEDSGCKVSVSPSTWSLPGPTIDIRHGEQNEV